MKTYSKIVTVLMAMLLLPSCESDEEKQREAQRRLYKIDYTVSQARREAESRRAAQDQAAIETLGRAIGQGLQQGSQPDRGNGGASQRDRDDYYRWQNEKRRQEQYDTIMRGQ